MPTRTCPIDADELVIIDLESAGVRFKEGIAQSSFARRAAAGTSLIRQPASCTAFAGSAARARSDLQVHLGFAFFAGGRAGGGEEGRARCCASPGLGDVLGHCGESDHAGAEP